MDARSHLRLYRLYHHYYTMAIDAATVIEHERILATIQARDGNGAEAAMLHHINQSMQRSEGARVRSVTVRPSLPNSPPLLCGRRLGSRSEPGREGGTFTVGDRSPCRKGRLSFD